MIMAVLKFIAGNLENKQERKMVISQTPGDKHI